MKHLAILLTLFTLHFSLFTLSASAAVPLKWTVETSRAAPAQFEAYQGETLAFEAALQSYGKPLEAPSNYSLYWQTNGMGSTYWSAPCVATASSPSNVLFATWSPTNDVGARVYNCFIGKPGTIYHAAFQLRLRPSPGATPNELPLPQKVIDFAKVTVLNPPWSGGGGGGVDTNAVRDIIHKTVDGSARYTPKYLWVYDCADSYPEDAAEYYRSRGDGKVDGGCSSVRNGGSLSRNFDYPLDERAEFVVKMSAGAGRFASVGVAQVGTNLTEEIVTSGKPNRCYKWLPGATVDGINENGVACCINVVDGDPQWGGGVSPALHPLAAIRWILDHATNAQQAATYIASHIVFPQGWKQNFHYMVADETSTYIVENGSAYAITNGVPALTNFRLYPTPSDGEGQERYVALTNGANITSQWWTLTYTASGYRESDLPGITGEVLTNLFNYWASKPREAHRGETFGGVTWWQTVHTSVYYITNRTLRICVQEVPDWYTFSLRSDGVPAVDEGKVREIVRPMIGASTNNLRRVEDMAVYDVARTENTDWTWESDDTKLASVLNAAHAKPEWYNVAEPSHWRVGAYSGYEWVDSPTRPDDEKRDDKSVILRFEHFNGTEYVYPSATARRPRYMDETLATSTNAALAAVVTNGTGKVIEGDLMKLDANGRLVKAIPAEDYATEVEVSQKANKEELDLKFDKTGGLISGSVIIEGESVEVYCSDVSLYSEKGTHRLSEKADAATTLSGYGITDGATKTELAAKQDALPYPTNAIPASAITGLEPPSSPSLRVYDSVRQCWWIGKMVNGVINWEVE